MDGHRCAAGALILLGALALTGCNSPGPPPSSAGAQEPAAGKVVTRLEPELAELGAFEVAVLPPSVDGADARSRRAFRDALYRGLLERGYSPLALDFVDAAGAAAGEPGRTLSTRSHVGSVRRAPDGGRVVSGRIGLVARGDGGEAQTLYACEITDLAVRDADAARALAAALLDRLPAR